MSRDALLIPADTVEPVRWVELSDNDSRELAQLQEMVGGFIEAVPVCDPSSGRYLEGVTSYINEEGKFDGSQPNPRATQLVGAGLFAGDDIRGPMVVCGFNAATGANESLPRDFERRLSLVRELRQPDEVDRGKRSAQFLWKLREEQSSRDDKVTATHYAVLTCGHSTKRFWSVVSRQSREPGEFGAMVIGLSVGDGVRVLTEPVERYSQKRFDAFCQRALALVCERYGASDPRLTKYFRVKSGGSL